MSVFYCLLMCVCTCWVQVHMYYNQRTAEDRRPLWIPWSWSRRCLSHQTWVLGPRLWSSSLRSKSSSPLCPLSTSFFLSFLTINLPFIKEEESYFQTGEPLTAGSPDSSSGLDLVEKTGTGSNTVGLVLYQVGLVHSQHLAILHDSSWYVGAKVSWVFNEYVLTRAILFCLNWTRFLVRHTPSICLSIYRYMTCLFCMYEYFVYMYVCVYHVCARCLQRSQEEIRCPGTGVMNGYELGCGWMLRIESGTSARATNAPCHWAVCPDPTLLTSLSPSGYFIL